MVMKIHHNTAKKATKLGIDLSIMENEFVAIKDGVTLATGQFGNVVLDDAIARLNGQLTGTPGSRAKLAAAFKSGATIPQALKAAKRTRDEDEIGDNDDGDPSDEEDHDEAMEAGDDEEGDPDDDRGNSIVKPKYKKLYKPHSYTCGDDLAQQIKAHLTVAAKDGKDALDLVALKRFAQANDCWQDKYALLNPGQARMNVGNRLRAKVKHGHTIVWK